MDKATIINITITIVPIITTALVTIFMKSTTSKNAVNHEARKSKNETPQNANELENQIDLFLPLDDNKKFLQEQNPMHIIWDDDNN